MRPEIYEYHINDNTYTVSDTLLAKRVSGPDYNYIFDKVTGEFMRWGVTKYDDPLFSPVGPELLDLEISVNGCPNGCQFCYKSNTNAPPTNMSFDTFKSIIDKFPKTLTQVAFGITGVQTNPDFLDMLAYCRKIGIVPNFTLTGIDLTDEMAKRIAFLVGAVAVSAYETNKNICYDTVKKFIDLGVKQTNIHLMLSRGTLKFAYEVLEDIQHDPRLAKLNAIVFLSVKPKGRASGKFFAVSETEFQTLVHYCLEHKVPFGFDSCSAPKFERFVKMSCYPEEQKETWTSFSEPCESSLFSAYVNVHGEYWHCSFSESEKGVEMVSLLATQNFINDVWYSKQVEKFRERVLKNRRRCVTFEEV